MNNTPVILLFGMPRSGTTWIGKIFDSHHQTLYRHEPDTWNKITTIPPLEDSNDFLQHCKFINIYLDKMVKSRTASVNGKMPFFPKNYSSPIRQKMHQASVLLSGAASKIINGADLPIIRPVGIKNSVDYVIVWKSIQLLGRMGVISRCLENHKGVLILRHPCGYIASILAGEKKNKFMSHTPASEDYQLYEKMATTQQARRYGLTLEKLKQLTPEERLAWRWVIFNEKAFDDTKDNKNITVLRYEDMCNNPHQTTKSLFEFCNLDWCQQTENFLDSSTVKNVDSYYSVFKDPKESASKWKKQLSKDKIDNIGSIISATSIGKFYHNEL